MSLTLRTGETVRATASIHWLSYTRPLLITTLSETFVVILLWGYLSNNPDARAGNSIYFVPFIFLALVPLWVRWLQNQARKFVVTNQRIVSEDGVFSRTSTEIPLNKINDVTLNQSLFQRMVGAGSVTVFTGNDLSTSFENISDPDGFRNAISER
jgi:uncharacterized membrane protein YdbT with pleckstrin-like domain